jgi:phage-related protein
VKELKFMGNSKESLANFPEQARREMGFELWQVQLGSMPSDAVVVLHCFHKTTPKTALPDIQLAAKRYQLIGVQHGKK